VSVGVGVGLGVIIWVGVDVEVGEVVAVLAQLTPVNIKASTRRDASTNPEIFFILLTFIIVLLGLVSVTIYYNVAVRLRLLNQKRVFWLAGSIGEA
jgi:uncharacterized membrane protein